MASTLLIPLIILIVIILIILAMTWNQSVTPKGSNKKWRLDALREPADPAMMDLRIGQSKVFQQLHQPEISIPAKQLTTYRYFITNPPPVHNYFKALGLEFPGYSRLVFGNGATELLSCYLTAYYRREFRQVYIQKPYPIVYPDIIENTGMTLVDQPNQADLEIIVSPGNPNGKLQKPQTNAHHLYDYTFNSKGYLGDNPLQIDPTADQLWSMSKILGLSGIRYGFGFINDPEIRKDMEDQIALTMRGIGDVSNYIANQYLEDPEKMKTMLNQHAETMQQRWHQLIKLVPTINQSGPFAMVQKPTEWFHQRGITTLAGQYFGSRSDWSRLPMDLTPEVWDTLTSRLSD